MQWQWIVLTVVLATITITAVHRSRRTGLPEIAIVPTFELTDHRGKPFGSKDLKGRIWIANFMFTSCPDVCPILTERMVNLHGRLEKYESAVQFVSFSVDPETDTPAVLAKYAKQRGAEFDNWAFLTGDLSSVRKVVVEGFKQAMEPLLEPGKPANVLHGSHFVLVDTDGVIRGYFASDPEGAQTVTQAVSLLLARREI